MILQLVSKTTQYLTARAKEPSSHAAMCGIFVGLSIAFPKYAELLGAIGGLLGITGVVIPEKSKN